MAGKAHSMILFLAVCMIFVISPASAKTAPDTIKMNVFERFRYEMTIAHDEAAAKFMNAGALAKWNGSIMPYFGKRDRQLSHFFAFSMLVPKMNQGDFYVSYFNPWIDGVLLTKWKKTGEDWKMADIYFASGERARREITPRFTVSGKNALPVWLRLKGTLLNGIHQYYKDMSIWLLNKDVREYMSWLSLSAAARDLDLELVRMRMKTRLELALVNIAKSNSGPALSGAFSKLKYSALIGDKQKLASYSRHGDIIADLPPEITKTWRENWYFKNGNSFTVILSSPLQPRLFLFMSIYESGKIQGVLLGDLETLTGGVETAGPVRIEPVKTSRKVRRFTNAGGQTVEITTERRGAKVTVTTRINGVVTEALTF